MTQAQFSQYAGIPIRTWEQWESGHRKPPEYVLGLLQRAVIEDADSGRLTGREEEWSGTVWEPIGRK